MVQLAKNRGCAHKQNGSERKDLGETTVGALHFLSGALASQEVRHVASFRVFALARFHVLVALIAAPVGMPLCSVAADNNE